MMRVVKREQITYEALQFTNESKDDIYTILTWYKCQKYPSFDDDNNPVLILQYGLSSKEVRVSLGDWIILDPMDSTVVKVISDDEFTKKYMGVKDLPSSKIYNRGIVKI